jgi:glucose uptake protein
MILSLLCLGSWAAMFKLAGKWRFELFYFDFAVGLALAALIYAFTVGNLGFDGFSFLDDLQHAGKRQWLFGFLAGVIFNFANMLLMAGVSVAGLSVAFPMSMGVAMLVGTLMSVIARAGANPLLMGVGCLLLFTSVLVNALSYRFLGLQQHEEQARAGQAKSTRRPSSAKGVIISMVSGVLMGSFGPLLEKARAGEVGLGPYALAAMFACGVFLTTPVFNIFFMNLPVEGDPVDLAMFFELNLKQHLLGFFAGMLWFTGVLSAMITGSVPDQIQGDQVSRAILLQAWPLLAALWGILVFRELKGAEGRIKFMSLLMLALFLCGMAMIALAPIYVAVKS